MPPRRAAAADASSSDDEGGARRPQSPPRASVAAPPPRSFDELLQQASELKACQARTPRMHPHFRRVSGVSRHR